MNGLTNSDRTILYGVMAFIAYQVWQSRKCACGQSGMGSGCGIPSSPLTAGGMTAPPWVQQLAQSQGETFFTPQCGLFGRCG